MRNKKVIAIAAMDEGRAIGFEGKLPWHLPEDLKRFAALTTGHAVLMGRATWDSIPEKYRPLPGRKNIVVTRHPEKLSVPKDVAVWTSPIDCIQAFKSGELETPSDILWIVGGAQIYEGTKPYWDEIQLTLVHNTYKGDAFFPEFDNDFSIVEDIERDQFSFKHYMRTPSSADCVV